MGKKRIALVGMGGIAQKVYAPLLAWNETVEVQGIMSQRASTVERMQAKYRFPRGTTELQELLGWELDAVFVHSPTETHYDIVKACLERGVSVYVDKPLTYDLKQSTELAALAERKGLLLGVGFNRRFAPMYVEAKAWMDQSGNGFVYGNAQKHRVEKQSHEAHLTIYDDLIHMLDLLLWLGREDYKLLGKQLIVDPSNRLELAAGLLTFGASTSTASFSMARTAGSDLESLELHGGGRSVEIINMETGRFHEKNALVRTQTFGGWESIWERRGFAGVVHHFLESLHKPETCEIRADLVLRTHKLAHQLLS